MTKLSIFLLLLAFSATSGKTDINYAPKALFREFKKTTGLELSQYTELIIADSTIQSHRIKGKFFKSQHKGSVVCYFYIGRVNSCRVDGCSINRESSANDDYEFFDYFIFFDETKRVLNVTVYNYEATHGQEITARGWLKQFIGFNGTKNLEVGKDIDGISGATISVYGITADIQHKTLILQDMLNN